MRAPDGAWTLDSPAPLVLDATHIDGVDDASVWLTTEHAVWQRQVGGSWVDLAAPVDLYEVVDLDARAADEVVVLRVRDDGATCSECTLASLLEWDGAAWSETVLGGFPGPVRAMVTDSSGAVLLGTSAGVRTGDGEPVSMTAPFDTYAMAIAPDDTVLALGWTELAMGSVQDGLVTQDVGLEVEQWIDAWAGSSSDVWVSAIERWENGNVPYAVILHWDGSAWSVVHRDDPSGRYALVEGGGQMFALGGWSDEVALVGGLGGFAEERRVLSADLVDAFALDDVTGEVWGLGVTSILGRLSAGSWEGVPLPNPSARPDEIVASDGRLALLDPDTLAVLADGVVSEVPNDPRLTVLAAADGVLFAAGDGPEFRREAGAGWQPIDPTGLPPDADPESMWADGPDDLWVGLRTDRGELWHWDGTAWTPGPTLRVAPTWIARLGDGELYLTQFESAGEGDETLWQFDGVVATPVPDTPPDVRSAARLADGTWFAMTVRTDEGTTVVLQQRDVGGVWVDVLTEARLPGLVGSTDSVWAAGDDSLIWSRVPCP